MPRDTCSLTAAAKAMRPYILIGAHHTRGGVVSARLSSKMDKEESAGEGLFSLKPVGCFWKAFFLVDFGNPPVDAKKIRPNA